MNNEKKDRSGGFPAKLLLVSYAMRRVTYLIRGLATGIYEENDPETGEKTENNEEKSEE